MTQSLPHNPEMRYVMSPTERPVSLQHHLEEHEVFAALVGAGANSRALGRHRRKAPHVSYFCGALAGALR
jgi:hypothetical protein